MNKNRADVPLDYALFRINEAFKVKDISPSLVTATDKADAEKKHDLHHYDRIPIKGYRGINQYYDFIDSRLKKIRSDDMLSSSTGVLETLSHLSRRDFYFVLEGNDITNFVHYSDLNNPLVYIGIYAQILYCEKWIRDCLRFKVKQSTVNNLPNESDNEKFLTDINKRLSNGKIDIKRAKCHFEAKKKAKIETDIFDELYFKEEFIISKELKLTEIDDTKIKKFNDLRNSIMHASPQIIKQKSDIQAWLEFLQECQNIIRNINTDIVKSKLGEI